MEEQASEFWDEIVPRVDPARCRRCSDCPSLAACAVYGIRRDGPDDLPVVDEGLCLGCYSCADACPHGAVVLPRAR